MSQTIDMDAMQEAFAREQEMNWQMSQWLNGIPTSTHLKVRDGYVFLKMTEAEFTAMKTSLDRMRVQRDTARARAAKYAVPTATPDTRGRKRLLNVEEFHFL